MDNNPSPQPEKPTTPEHFLLQGAIEHMRAGRVGEARQNLKRYLRLNPDSVKGWFLLSYVVQEPEHKLDCLRRALDLNPTHWKAQERLEQIKAEMEKPSKTKAKRKRGSFPIWAVVGLFTLMGVAVIIAGTLSFRALRNAPRPEPQVARQPTHTPSPTRQPVIGVPAATPTPTITASPPPPATPMQEDPQIAAQMDQIQAQVSELRELAALSTNKRTILEEWQVQPVLENFYLARHTKADVADQARVLSALGLIEPTYDLYTKTLNQIGEGLGGFYIPWTDELFVISEGEFSGIERFVFAHEYGHALVDQHFSLDAIGVYPECLTDTDRCLAITALIEGDATYLMYAWLETYGTAEDVQDIQAAQYTPTDRTISSTNLPPLYLVRETQFRYEDGYNFVRHLIEKGKWQMVDLAYGRLPTTSEQILHPDKFQAGERAKPVEIPDLQGALGEGWRRLTSDTLGELGTEMLLGYGADYLANLEAEIAKEAAVGWGGDNYQLYYQDTTNQKALALYWVGDSWIDTYEFTNALAEHLELLYRGDRVERDNADCWQQLNDHVTCIFKTQYQALWVTAPDFETVELIHAQYPSIP